jgi:hypothetical protein
MLEKLVAIMLAWSLVWWPEDKPRPETDEARKVRITYSAGTIVKAVEVLPKSQQKIMVAAVTVTWKFEAANLDYTIHAGLPTPLGTYDHGKAHCPGQIQTWPGNTLLTHEEWEALVGTDEAATQRCANATVKYMWHLAKLCLRKDKPKAGRWGAPLEPYEVALMLSAYGKGKCVPLQESIQKRMPTYYRIRAQLG